ncbi:hypothetical protein COLO4_32258 [Corchorus olitorius]|uniref:Uncharacterized protein n=1 Tax=Corchorus olitorius TaxID=93759 RepID=A0A1R3GZY4_9ROSI|nr:hypothetical protein COLO4_32258 [Corchorus olitorius]
MVEGKSEANNWVIGGRLAGYKDADKFYGAMAQGLWS